MPSSRCWLKRRSFANVNGNRTGRLSMTNNKQRSFRWRALTLQEVAQVLDLSTTRVKICLRHGLLCGHAYNNSNACLYEHPGENPPRKAQGVRYSKRLSATQVVAA